MNAAWRRKLPILPLCSFYGLFFFLQLTKALGIDCKVLEQSEVKDIYPLMDVNPLLGAVFCPEDGSVEPSGLTAAYSRAATKNGAKVRPCGDL